MSNGAARGDTYPRSVRDPEDDELLVRRAQAGDRAAFGSLLDRWLPRIRAFLFRLEGARGNPDDLAQETFLVAVARLAELREPSSVGSWLFGIALRVQRAAGRRARSQRNGAAPGGLDVALGGAVAPRDPLEGAEELRAVTDAIDRLPENLREAFVLRHVEELPPAAAAAVLGVPEGTLRRWDHEARERLRRMLGSRSLASGGRP